MCPLAEQVRRIFGVDLDELAGTSIAAEIPLSNDLVNRLIAQRLAASPSAIAAAHAEAQDHDNVGIELSLRGPKLLPAVRIAARIDRQPDLPRAPVLGLRWSVPGLGPLGLLAAPALTWFKALPPGIRADGDRLDVDIGAVLRSQGLGELLPYIAALQVHTRRGAFLVRFELRIPRAGEP
jgi:hypothetical protein